MYRKERVVKGIIITTELLLILSGIILFAFTTMLNLGKMVMSQATSEKGTATISEAHVWKVSDGGKCFLNANVYISNLGSNPIYINGVYIIYANGTVGSLNLRARSYINPAETASVTGYTTSCSGLPTNGYTQVIVKYHVAGESRVLSVSKPVRILSSS